MFLPIHVDAKQINDNQYLLTNQITSTNIKIGANELYFLSYLYKKNNNIKAEIHFQLNESQQAYLEQKFNELGFLSKKVSTNILNKRKGSSLARFPIAFLNPESFLNKISFLTNRLMTKTSLFLIILLNFLAFTIFGLHHEVWLQQISLEKMNFSDFIIIYIMIILTLAIHELSHAITCHFYGGKVRQIGIMVFYFNLALYCDVSSTYKFKEKYKKVIVILSGLISQMIISSISIISYYILTFFGYNLNLLLYFSLLNFLIVIMNLIPLVKLDGYWLLTQLLDISNLRDKSFRYMISLFLPRYKTVTLQFPVNEIKIFKYYGLSSFIFTTLFWSYGIYYLYKLTSNINEWISISVVLILGLLVIIHFYNSFIRYIIQMNKELNVFLNTYHKSKVED